MPAIRDCGAMWPIKMLQPQLAGDAGFSARLAREAEAVAALRHPNICVLHDVGTEGGTSFLVMELLDGETLAARLARGSLPLDQALGLALDIARALGAAHRAGVVHRDLKPGNIILTSAGPKLLDFGLAKLRPDPIGTGNVGATRTSLDTTPGTFVGTLPYMSPEQLEGRPTDARTDIFAFGIVFYEMLTGHRPFDANTTASLVAAILEHETPPVLANVPSAPPLVERILRRCLAKNPDARWQSADDLAEAIVWVTQGAPAPTASRARRGSAAVAWIAAALATLFGVAALLWRSMPGAITEPLRLSMAAPEGLTFTPIDLTGAPTFALSPDGRRLAFLAAAKGERPRVWVRAFDSGAVQPVAATDDATGFFWSPDGRSLGFFSGGKLSTVTLDGGSRQVLLNVAVDVTGGSWGPDGTILFAGGTGDGLSRVSAAGGVVTPVTTLDQQRKDIGHRWPLLLPGGRYLFYVRSAQPENSGVYLGSLDSTEARLVLRSLTSVVFVEPDHLLFEQGGTLKLQRLDLSSGTLVAQPIALPDRVSPLLGPSRLPVSLGAGDRMAYWNGRRPEIELAWFDRSGRHMGRAVPVGLWDGPRLSPDGERLLLSEAGVGMAGRDLHVFTLSSGVDSRLTFTPGFARFGLWSGKGTRVILSDIEAGVPRFVERSASGSGDEKPLLAVRAFAAIPTDISRDDRVVIYQTSVAKSGWDIALINTHDRTTRIVIAEAGNQLQGRLSPDGRWLAYATDERGRWEVQVQSFPGGAGRWQVSQAGGSQPVWSPDGKELFYIAADGVLTAVPIGSGEAFSKGREERLFQTRVGPMLAPYITAYTVSTNGRFLVNTVVPDTPPPVITIVDRWRAGLGK